MNPKINQKKQEQSVEAEIEPKTISETISSITEEQKEQTAQSKNTESTESKELAEMIDLLKRTQANFENYRKQTEKRLLEIQQFAAQNIILQLLPLYDNLELALKNIPPAEKTEQVNFIKGIELIFTQLNQLLEQNGVQPILTKNQKFDPYYHEALLRVESELPENIIIEEFQKGFTFQNKVLRLAKVKISSGKQEIKK